MANPRPEALSPHSRFEIRSGFVEELPCAIYGTLLQVDLGSITIRGQGTERGRKQGVPVVQKVAECFGRAFSGPTLVFLVALVLFYPRVSMMTAAVRTTMMAMVMTVMSECDDRAPNFEARLLVLCGHSTWTQSSG